MKVSTTLSYRVTWQLKARVSQDPCQRERRRVFTPGKRWLKEGKEEADLSWEACGAEPAELGWQGGDTRTPRYDACGSVRSQSVGKESQEIRLTKDTSGSLAVTGSKKGFLTGDWCNENWVGKQSGSSVQDELKGKVWEEEHQRGYNGE